MIKQENDLLHEKENNRIKQSKARQNKEKQNKTNPSKTRRNENPVIGIAARETRDAKEKEIEGDSANKWGLWGLSGWQRASGV